MSAHTPGPWTVITGKKTGRVMVRGADGSLVCTLADATPGYPVTAADAERIVACVNFCEGWEPGKSGHQSMRDVIADNALLESHAESLRTQRDVLLAALRYIVNNSADGEDATLDATGYNMACAAIAKAEGRT